MNVCIVAKYHYTERIGGAEVQAWLLARELAHRGVDVTYICESLSGKDALRETIDGVETCWIKGGRRLDIFNFPRYARALGTARPDIVIHRTTSGVESLIGWYCRRNGIKFLWICTDDSIPVRSFFTRRQRAMLRRFKRPIHKRAALLAIARLKDISREIGLRWVTHPCVQNTDQFDTFQANFGRRAYRFPSGHDIPDRLPEKSSPPVVLWVAGFSAGKRPELFLELAQACADLPLRFIMISKRFSGETHVDIADFERQAKALENFEWHIDVPFDETLTWFGRASVFVSTSKRSDEGFPNTFIQAWSRGVPVVSFDVDPDDILVKDGLGIRIDSIADARTAIQEYMNRPDIVDVRKHLHATAQSRFSITLVADRLFEIAGSPPR